MVLLTHDDSAGQVAEGLHCAAKFIFPSYYFPQFHPEVYLTENGMLVSFPLDAKH
ncbi:hypothetical protein GHT06_018785 [Daphnia sinensis]|uniref:Uncharacterized protein n=1 Tax=Daphnia sinensis TaxID=1820382 RepID=A0AAD5L529_9CRUS|nr:hypothetical protein GHT06_018785 [Daphnia sinensis]